MLINRESGEIFVYGPIGSDFFDEGISAELMIQALDQLGGKRASVRINSPGGVADEGIAIYNALKRYPGGVDTYVDAVAASAASIIGLAGEKRITAKGGRWMIHRAMTMEVGNASAMRKTADTLETYDRSLAEIYADIMGIEQDAILDLMDAETWYTSTEAVAAGLSTIEEGTADKEPAVAAWYRNPPAAIAASSTPVVRPRYPLVRKRHSAAKI